MNKLYELLTKNDKATSALMSLFLILGFSAIYANLLGTSGICLGIAIGTSLSMSLNNGITAAKKKTKEPKKDQTE